MVKKTENSFSKIIEEYNPMDIKKSLELKKILNSYPYFQSASAHYLKTLKLQEKDAYYELLPKTAILTFDRSILRNWLYSELDNEVDDKKEKYSFLDWFDSFFYVIKINFKKATHGDGRSEIGKIIATQQLALDQTAL